MPVVAEKPQAGGGDRQRDPEHERVGQVLDVRGQQHPAQPGREGHPSRDAVDTVHEVIRVGETHDPQEGDHHPDQAQVPLAEQGDGDGLEVSQSPDGYRGDQSLHREADQRRERTDVILPAQESQDHPRDEVDQGRLPVPVDDPGTQRC